MMYALLIIIIMNSQGIYRDDDNADLMPHFQTTEAQLIVQQVILII